MEGVANCKGSHFVAFVCGIDYPQLIFASFFKYPFSQPNPYYIRYKSNYEDEPQLLPRYQFYNSVVKCVTDGRDDRGGRFRGFDGEDTTQSRYHNIDELKDYEDYYRPHFEYSPFISVSLLYHGNMQKSILKIRRITSNYRD